MATPKFLECDSIDQDLGEWKEQYNYYVYSRRINCIIVFHHLQCFPGKIGRLEIISAKIQPTDQMSTR